MKLQLGRRDFFKHASGIGLGIVGSALFFGCKKGSSGAAACNDLSGLSDAQQAVRKGLQYTTKSAEAGKNCGNCKLLKPAEKPGTCAGCTLFQGPVELAGYCIGWQAKS